MNPYSFTVSLRVTHPMWQADRISTALNLRPSVEWSVGSPKTDGAGVPLGGVRDETYWSHSFGEPQQGDVTLFLEQCVAKLATYRDFFDKVVATGGEIELFIGVFGDRNLGIIIPVDLMEQLSELHLALAFDVYPQSDCG